MIKQLIPGESKQLATCVMPRRKVSAPCPYYGHLLRNNAIWACHKINLIAQLPSFVYTFLSSLVTTKYKQARNRGVATEVCKGTESRDSSQVLCRCHQGKDKTKYSPWTSPRFFRFSSHAPSPWPLYSFLFIALHLQVCQLIVRNICSSSSSFAKFISTISFWQELLTSSKKWSTKKLKDARGKRNLAQIFSKSLS